MKAEYSPAEVNANKAIFDEHFDLEYAISLTKNVINLIDDYYFRSQFIGFDQIPKRNNAARPLIYASNHSGMAFPWDAIIFCTGFLKRNNFELKNAARPLTAPALSNTRLMSPYLIPNFWKRLGCVDATLLNFQTMMDYQESNLLVYPEGVAGIAKGFKQRYQLQRFSNSFIRMSLRYKTEIIPFATINGEYIHPYSLSFPGLNKVVQKLGIPFLPLSPISLFLLLQPWLFYFGLPARLTYVMGEPIRPWQMIDKPIEGLTSHDINVLRDEIQGRVQKLINDSEAEYGQKAYRHGQLFKLSLKNLRRVPFYLPGGWALLFREHERVYSKAKEALPEKKKPRFKLSFPFHFKALFKNPSSFLLYIPVIGLIYLLWQGRRKSST